MEQSKRIVKIVRTCSACPSQWDLFADDGTSYYARYRHGYFYCEDSFGKTCATWNSGNSWEGVMSDDEMKKILEKAQFVFVDGE
jgi:hypothetical protein